MYQNQLFSVQDKENYDEERNGGRVWDWEGAKKYCKNLKLNGYSDWELPTKYRLERLLTTSKSKNSKGYEYYIKKEFLENMPPISGKYYYGIFWSSSSSGSYAHSVIFGLGRNDYSEKSNNGYVLCIRGHFIW